MNPSSSNKIRIYRSIPVGMGFGSQKEEEIQTNPLFFEPYICIYAWTVSFPFSQEACDKAFDNQSWKLLLTLCIKIHETEYSLPK